MADNVNLTAGDGTIIGGADVIGGVSYPRAKVVWGPDNTVNDADVASGKPLPVQLRGSDGTDRSNALPASQSGTWTVQPGNTANTTAWKVDNTAAVDKGSGTGGSATQRVIVDSSQLSALVAHDGADSGNPIKIGGRARSSEISAVANNDRSDLLTDLVGKLIVLPYANPENFVSGAITCNDRYYFYLSNRSSRRRTS